MTRKSLVADLVAHGTDPDYAAAIAREIQGGAAAASAEAWRLAMGAAVSAVREYRRKVAGVMCCRQTAGEIASMLEDSAAETLERYAAETGRESTL